MHGLSEALGRSRTMTRYSGPVNGCGQIQHTRQRHGASHRSRSLSMDGLLRLHALCVNLVAQLWRSAEADARLMPNCLFGLYSANFPIGNADSWIPGSTRLHNTVHRSLVSRLISRLLRVHMTPPYYILCIYTVSIVRMDRYCSTR